MVKNTIIVMFVFVSYDLFALSKFKRRQYVWKADLYYQV